MGDIPPNTKQVKKSIASILKKADNIKKSVEHAKKTVEHLLKDIDDVKNLDELDKIFASINKLYCDLDITTNFVDCNKLVGHYLDTVFEKVLSRDVNNVFAQKQGAIAIYIKYLTEFMEFFADHASASYCSPLAIRELWGNIAEDPSFMDHIRNVIIHSHVDTMIDFGSGRGHISRFFEMDFKAHNIKMKNVAIDNDTEIECGTIFFKPIKGDVDVIRKYAHKNAILIISWPYPGHLTAENALRLFMKMGGVRFMYCGEDRDGVTASSGFFDLLDDEWTLLKSWRQIQLSGYDGVVEYYERNVVI